MNSGLSWAGTGLLLVGLGTAGFFAFQRGRANEAKLAASEQAKRIVIALAKCAADKATSESNSSLPPSARPIPSDLRDLRNNTQTWSELAREAPYICVGANDPAPLMAQVVWIRGDGEKTDSRFFARIDPDGDGKPDGYFEAPLACQKQSGCLAPTHPYTVEESGLRVPPPLAGISGRLPPYKGAPPHLDDAMSPDRVDAPSRPGQSVEAPPVKRDLPDLSGELTGKAAPFSMVLEGALAMAAKTEPSFTLVRIDVRGMTGESIDPSQGQKVELHFGQVDSNERLSKGTRVLVVSYEKAGLVSVQSLASADALAITVPRCSAVEALRLGQGQSASLGRTPKQNRELWIVEGKKKGQKLGLDAETCAIVRL